MSPAPRLSIVIPTLNEDARIGALIEQIARQTLVAECEVIIADGGSSDDTLAQARLAAERHCVKLDAVISPHGRGLQMNSGARAAQASDVLFLHADSDLPEADLLAMALAAMEAARSRFGPRVAGHFPLRFARHDCERSLMYFFFEAKTALNRLECINGDQGMWFSAEYFVQLGGFDSTLAYLEDARIARRVFASGVWITLPGHLVTSARRFESEGFARRQALNALLRTCDVVGLHRYLERATTAYREQRDTGPLRLAPFLSELGQALDDEGWRSTLVYLGRAGHFLTVQTWQLAFWWDCRRAFLAQRIAHPMLAPTLGMFDRWIAPLVTSLAGVVPTTVVLIVAWRTHRLIRVVRKYS